MSIMINDRKHFDSIAEGIMDLHKSKDFHFNRETVNLLPELNFVESGTDLKEQIDKIIATLIRMQVTCYCSRYRLHPIDQDVQMEIEAIKSELFTPIILRPIPLYKAIECALYQVETEYIEDLRPLTPEEHKCLSFFKRLKNQLAHHIVRKLPEYDTAEWAIK